MRGRFKRQPHIKLCAIGTRAEVDFSVMTFDDDSVADDQAKSRAGSALGCEEGHRKDVGLDLCRDSAAIVSDLDEKKLAVAARADIDATRPADGVNRIVDEVRPDLVLTRRRRRLEARKRAIKVARDRDVPELVTEDD